MDCKQERIYIPEVVYTGEDKVLKERVTKFKAGSLRIFLFTIVGFVMGAYSHNYIADDFIVTKIILAIPYKICEAIYVFLIGTDAKEILHTYGIVNGLFTSFFPCSMLATFLAEKLTTIFISGAIYGSAAYFTGDKRVFTLQRFFKFFACWCVIILILIGTAYGVNAWERSQIEESFNSYSAEENVQVQEVEEGEWQDEQ